jgi:UDPglucose 6-dehydrogenase
MLANNAQRRVAVIGLGAIGKPLLDVLGRYHDARGHDLKGPDNWPHVIASNVVFVCVGTPENSTRRLDHGRVRDVLARLAGDRFRGVVVVRSTLGIGALKTLRHAYRDLRLVYMPEFLRERSAFQWIVCPDRIVVSGAPEDCDASIAAMPWVEPEVPILRMTDASAELGKLAHNAFIAWKITFANLIGRLANLAGADADDVMAIIHNDRRVKTSEHLQPTLEPFGGKCVPKDTQELANAFEEATLLRETLRFNDALKLEATVNEPTVH